MTTQEAAEPEKKPVTKSATKKTKGAEESVPEDTTAEVELQASAELLKSPDLNLTSKKMFKSNISRRQVTQIKEEDVDLFNRDFDFSSQGETLNEKRVRVREERLTK